MEKRNKIFNENLNVNGKKIEKLLTSVMMTSDADDDVYAAVETGYGIRSLLLARLYTMKFLDSNSKEDANRVHKEFSNLEEQLIEIKEQVQNPQAEAKLVESISLIKKYEDGVDEIVKIINDRNKVIDRLNKIGPDIAEHAENIKLSIKKDQDTIGPEVVELNDNILRMAIIIAIVVIIMVLISAIFISREISTQLDRFQSGLLGFFKYLNRETNTVEMLDDSSNNEIGIMSKVVNKNIQKTKNGIEEDRKLLMMQL
jgi:methyl-accepting chemotaxis protein